MRNGKQNQGGGQRKVEEKAETANDGKKDEKETGNSNKEIVLKVYMHCEGCSTKVSNCLKGFDGVEQVKTEVANDRVIVRGQKADPAKVLKRIQKKYSRNAELISPKIQPKENKKEAEKKEDQPQVKIAVLKMYIHCEGCANDIKKNIERMPGILSVQPDMNKSLVTVRGVLDTQKLVEIITKRLGKHVQIVKQEGGESGDKGKGNNNKRKEEGNMFYYPPQYSMQHVYPTQIFSDENVFSCSIM